ncbi:cytochrome P450 6k1-like [Pieris napi]|uniref:cytochrome P450 6k1-like n=1 Tax=Pieris napi TaxID=78633 RepID=UPI001FBB9D6A|nr:cytochrome P450 6k1-like [Pieris napi]
MVVALVLLFSIFVLFLIYLNGKYNENYWKRRNIKFYPKNKVTGLFWDYVTKDKSFFENFRELYREYRNDIAVGFGAFLTPALFIVEPTNIQHVLSTDFNAFNHRGIDVNERDKLADNILFMKGNRWKLMRQAMTPLFTVSKLKSMYYIIDKSAADFVILLKNNPNLWESKTFDTISSFSSAAIGAAVFGVSTNSIFDSPFLNMARDAFKSTLITDLKFALANISTSLFETLDIAIFKDHEMFFIHAIKQVLREREKENKKKHDFADLCIQIQNAGIMIDKDTGLQLEPTDELLAAQAFFFFIAGVEPTASVIFSTLIELGQHPEYLERLHKEIDITFDKCNNKMSYEIIGEMKFLDMVFSETLRLHPPIGFLRRQCIQDSMLPVGNLKVEKGTRIFTPVYEIHHDEKYHPDPEVFNPERFSPENKHNISDTTYMPFGRGNRICAGMRYATLQTKAGIIHLLRHFSVKAIIKEGGIRYRKQPVQVRLDNVDIKFIPRTL